MPSTLSAGDGAEAGSRPPRPTHGTRNHPQEPRFSLDFAKGKHGELRPRRLARGFQLHPGPAATISARPEKSSTKIFAELKAWAALWLAAVATIGGAFGGTSVSGALWASWLQPPLWLAAIAATASPGIRTTRSVSGESLAFLTGWCLWWGMVIGAVAMWAAQLSGAGWAYGVAVGIGFFFVGIIQGIYEPDALQSHDGWFMLQLGAGTDWGQRRRLGSPQPARSADDPRNLGVSGSAGGIHFPGPGNGILLCQAGQCRRVEAARFALSPPRRNRRRGRATSCSTRQSGAHRTTHPCSTAARWRMRCAVDGGSGGRLGTAPGAGQPKSHAPPVARGWVALRGGRDEEQRHRSRVRFPLPNAIDRRWLGSAFRG